MTRGFGEPTRSVAVLRISRAAYDEIAALLRAAGYDHAFQDGGIDMNGILVAPNEKPKETG